MKDHKVGKDSAGRFPLYCMICKIEKNMCGVKAMKPGAIFELFVNTI